MRVREEKGEKEMNKEWVMWKEKNKNSKRR